MVASGRIGPVGYHQKYMDSGGLRLEYVQRMLFSSASPRIDCAFEVKCLKGRHYRLRAVFPLGLEGDVDIFYEIPFGEVKRPEGEFLAQNYMRCEDGDKGMAILNKGIPGNNVTDGVMMLSLMRSAYQEYLDPCEMALEEGETHFFEYAVLPYKTSERPDFARIASEFNTPPVVCVSPEAPPAVCAESVAPADFAGMEVAASEVCVSAIYRDGDAIVCRLWNSASMKVECVVSSPYRAGGAVCVCDATLENSAEIAVDNGRFSLEFGAFEIKTIVFQFGS